MIPAWAGDMVLFENGVVRAPLLVPNDAPEETVRAAETLARCIAQTCGSRPEVRRGPFPVVPQNAVWIGAHPELAKILPRGALEFSHPEETRIVCTGGHLVLAGRDRFVGGRQTEFGTANAVYTFLQKHLGVRWLWPGALGEDIRPQQTLRIPEFESPFHPPFRQRDVFRRLEGENALKEWARVQRNLLDSFFMPNGHAFTNWWERFHQGHPDYFALQPDGTRSGFPGPTRAKLFEANPRVWRQWLDDAASELETDPALTVLHAAPNDSSNSGVSVDPESRAWDNPKGAPYVYSYAGGVREEYVALSDRYVTFWNLLGRGLKERFPGREVYVGAFAYGPTKHPPAGARLDDNVALAFVGHFPVADEASRTEEKANWKGWAANASFMVYRPNLFIYSGAWHAMPSVALRNTIEDFRFLAENKCQGITIDTTPEFWAGQCVQYYLMAQLAWDPLQDGEAVVRDFYERGFGRAADAIAEYFRLAEDAHMRILQSPGWRPSLGGLREITRLLPTIYDAGFLAEAERILDRAEAAAAAGLPIHRERVRFVRTSLDFARVQTELIRMMTRVRESGGRDAQAVFQAVALSGERDEIFRRFGGIALSSHRFNVTFNFNSRRDLRDDLGPPNEQFLEAARAAEAAALPSADGPEPVPVRKPSAPEGEGDRVFRWSGKGDNAFWSTSANWQARRSGRWVTAVAPPGPGATIMLTDATAQDAPLRIELDSSVTAGRIIFEAARGGRSYSLVTRTYDAPDEDLDADSGRVFALTLTDEEPLVFTEGSANTLSIAVGLRLTAKDAPRVRMDSRHGARLVIRRPVASSHPLDIRRPVAAGNGIVEYAAP